MHDHFFSLFLNLIGSNLSFVCFAFLFSPPDIPEHVISPRMNGTLNPREFHNLPSNLANIDDLNGSFEDEDDENSHPVDQPTPIVVMKAFALYDFNGQSVNGGEYVNAAAIFVGECVNILEDDQGDGWTRIEKLDGTTGFVPSSYLRIESSSSSSQPIESGRF